MSAKVEPRQSRLRPADTALAHEVHKGGIGVGGRRFPLPFQARNVHLEDGSLALDQVGDVCRAELLGHEKLERKVDTHVAWVVHGRAQPVHYGGTPLRGETIDAALRTSACILLFACNQAVLLQSSQECIEMAGAEVDDIPQRGIRHEMSGQIVAMSGAVKQQSKKGKPGGVRGAAVTRHGCSPVCGSLYSLYEYSHSDHHDGRFCMSLRTTEK